MSLNQTSDSDSDQLSSRFKICLDALRASSNDTQKLSALMIVSTTISPNNLNHTQTTLLFDAIGWKFLYRLLITKGKDEDGMIYQSLASSILASLYLSIGECYDQSHTHIEKKHSIKVLIAMIRILEDVKTCDDEEMRQLVMDILTCYECVIPTLNDTSDHDLIQKLFTSKLIPNLIQNHLYFTETCIQPLISQRIHKLLVLISSHLKWIDHDASSFDQFMILISNEFKSNQGERKFQLCEEIEKIVKKNFKLIEDKTIKMKTMNHDIPSWIDLISVGLFDIFRSKLTQKQRNLAFYLASTLTCSLDGYKWMLKVNCSPHTHDDSHLTSTSWNSINSKFFSLLSRLVCIEIKLNLESSQVDANLLGACYMLLEYSIKTLSYDEQITELLTAQDIYSLLNDIKETIANVIQFLDQINEDELEKQQTDESSIVSATLIASIRMIMIWTIEETHSLRSELASILPMIIKVMMRGKSTNNDDLMSFNEILIPALHSLCESDEAIRSVLQTNEESINQLIKCIKNDRRKSQDVDLICICDSLNNLLSNS